MGAQAAEQIIAGVVLSERLAVTMYGAIHRAQFGGDHNLRGLIVDPQILTEDAFRLPLTDPKLIATVTRLAHPNIVPTVAVEWGGPDVVIVTRGAGRYVTVQDLITSAKARTKQGGKLSTPVAASIGKSVIEGLAAAHRAGVIHGAVHPRSVVLDEDGGVRLGDFVVGRALTTAVAQGADSSMWRGLAGYIAPELVVGEDPTPGVDVFAVGAMLFTMLSGEAPPGPLRVTPAIERLVQRALDTDMQRRYRSATDLLENLLEAIEDDRWELADAAELITEAGFSRPDSKLDDATEDLLASLGSAPESVQIMPSRSSAEIRAEPAARMQSPTSAAAQLDELLADLDEPSGVRSAEPSLRRSPISEVRRAEARKDGSLAAARVPSLDDPDDDTPLPAPMRDSHPEIGSSAKRTSGARGPSLDEAAAFAAIGDLDEGARRVSNAAEQAAQAAVKLEQAAARAERAAKRVDSNSEFVRATPRPVAAMPEPIELDVKPPRLKSRMVGIVSLIVVVAGVGGFFYIYKQQEAASAAAKREHEEAQRKADELTHKLTEELPDPGTIKVTSTPSQAGVWLSLGRTPLDSLPLSSGMMHELRIEGVDGYQPVDTQVLPIHWSGDKDQRKATVAIALKPVAMGKKATPAATKLPPMPPKPPTVTGYVDGRGPIHVDSTPPGAEVWMFIGMTDQVELSGIQAGLAYQLRVLEDGYLPGYISITPDEWRDGGDPNVPINAAKKKPVIDKHVDLVIDPNAIVPRKGK